MHMRWGAQLLIDSKSAMCLLSNGQRPGRRHRHRHKHRHFGKPTINPTFRIQKHRMKLMTVMYFKKEVHSERSKYRGLGV